MRLPVGRYEAGFSNDEGWLRLRPALCISERGIYSESRSGVGQGSQPGARTVRLNS